MATTTTYTTKRTDRGGNAMPTPTQLRLDHVESADERAARLFPVGSLVRQRGYDVTFEVVGHWRGQPRLQEPKFGTTHVAALSELVAVECTVDELAGDVA